MGLLPQTQQFHILKQGDVLRLTSDVSPARPWRTGMDGTATMGFTPPEALDGLRVGHRVLLDDGKISGVAEQVADDHVDVRILVASRGGNAAAG